jgi:hypothetical protein
MTIRVPPPYNPPQQAPDRTIPGNDHVWDDLQQLTAQVRAFQDRLAQRRAAFYAGARELEEVEEKTQAALRELIALDGQESARAS